MSVKWTRYKICQSQNQQRKLKISIHQISCPWSPCKETVHYLGRCSCFVSCIPSLVLLSDIIFAILSVMSSWRKKQAKKQRRTEPTWTKSQLECFVVQPGETIIFIARVQISIKDCSQSGPGDSQYSAKSHSVFIKTGHHTKTNIANLITWIELQPSTWQNTNRIFITQHSQSQARRLQIKCRDHFLLILMLEQVGPVYSAEYVGLDLRF